MGDVTYIHKLDGNYLGFIYDGILFSRDGVNLGWMENDLVWDTTGKFRGVLIKVGSNNYILRNILSLPPLPRTPKTVITPKQVFPPVPNISAISPNIGFQDAF